MILDNRLRCDLANIFNNYNLCDKYVYLNVFFWVVFVFVFVFVFVYLFIYLVCFHRKTLDELVLHEMNTNTKVHQIVRELIKMTANMCSNIKLVDDYASTLVENK